MQNKTVSQLEKILCVSETTFIRSKSSLPKQEMQTCSISAFFQNVQRPVTT